MLQVNFTAQANGNTQRNSVSGQVCKCPSYHLSMKTACPSASQFEFQVLLLPNLQKKKKQCELQNQYSWLFKKQNQRKDSAHSASMWSGVERLEVVSCQYCSCSTRTCLVEPISTSSITGVIQCARKIHQVTWPEFVPENFWNAKTQTI